MSFRNLKLYLLILFALSPLFSLYAQKSKMIEHSTDIAMFITPATGFIKSLIHHDYQGTKQMLFSGITNLAVCYALKYSIKKQRPDHSDNHAFPSNHTSVSFQGATFLQKRYGWKWGIPAYLLSAYVGWGRTYCNQHDWWDVLGGALIGSASAYIFTRPFVRKQNLTFSPAVINNRYPGIYAAMIF